MLSLSLGHSGSSASAFAFLGGFPRRGSSRDSRQIPAFRSHFLRRRHLHAIGVDQLLQTADSLQRSHRHGHSQQQTSRVAHVGDSRVHKEELSLFQVRHVIDQLASEISIYPSAQSDYWNSIVFRSYRNWATTVKKALVSPWFTSFRPSHFSASYHLWHFKSPEVVADVIQKLAQNKVHLGQKLGFRRRVACV